MVKKISGVFSVLLCGLLSASCQEGSEGVDAGWGSWASYAGSVDSSQYSSLKQINKENVSQLEVAWTFPTGKANHRSTPLVIDDVMYVVANGGVTALDAASGEQRWFAPESVTAFVRGLAYWQSSDEADQRLLVIRDHYLQALNARTGDLVLSFGNDGRVDLREGLGRDPETITRIASMTPGRVFENLIILGSAMGDDDYGPAPGDIRAYDVITGEMVWTFHTIPHPGEAGYETWPPDAWKSVGAANVWSSMSIDEERGIVYAPTGAPSYHFFGGNRVGDNLYANSLIALDARTGERLWHFQAVHHDIWDYDLPMAPKLLSVEHNGEKIDAVALAGKQGFLFVFDRVSGEPIFPIEERAVPQSDVPGEQASPTQPYPLTVPAFANLTLAADNLSPHADPEQREALAERIRQARNEGLFTPPSFRGSVSAPGSRGGAQHGNGAVVPHAGLFYLAVIESPTIPVLELRRQSTSEHYLSSSPREIYSSDCAVCHGPQGKGQPPLFPSVTGIASRLSSEEFLELVAQGRGRMAAFPDIPEARVVELMEYVNKLDDSAPLFEPQHSVVDVSGEERKYRSGYHHFFTETGLLGPTPWSRLVAYDLNAGKILWQKPYGDVVQLAAKGIHDTGSLFPTNSLTATAGGLLFSATNDRKFRAWDRDTGDVLWTSDLPADPGGIPAVYEIDGRQYIVATATRGNSRSNSKQAGDNAYVVFTLSAEPH